VPARASASRIATLIATGLGSGYSPFAPGTAGSAVGALFLLPFVGTGAWPLAVAIVILFAVGVWASGHVAAHAGLKDPGIVVVDEVIGMWISVLGLPLTLPIVLAGFVLFRIFDVVKPPPARQFEALPGGYGIVCDDVMAGIYANLVLRAALWLWGAR
jgi:phosphatidylglycerophosphatase A